MCHDNGVRLGVIGAVVLAATACGPPGFDSQVRQYVRLAVALGERDPDSIDFYYGPPQWAADIRKHPPRLEEIRRSAVELGRQMEPDRHARAKHLAGQLKAIATRADELLGRQETFDQKTSAYFGLTVPATALRDTEQDRRGN